MNKKYLTIIVITFASFFLIALFFILNKSNNQLTLNTNRVFNDKIKLEKIVKLDKKLSVMKLYKDTLYFVSWTKNNQGKLFRYNITKEVFEKELDLNEHKDSLLIDNYYIEKNTLFFINKLNKTLVTSDKNGKIIEKFKYPKSFSRLVKKENEVLISGWDDNFKIYFEKTNLSTHKSISVVVKDDYLTKYSNTGITLDGFYQQNNTQAILVPYSVNRVYLFDNNLSYSGKIDLIYDFVDFKYRKTENKDVLIDPSNLNPNLSSSVENENLYILTDQSTKWSKKDKCFIDIYNLNTKKYIKSIKIQDFDSLKPRHILVNKNKLYVLFEDTLNIYKIN